MRSSEPVAEKLRTGPEYRGPPGANHGRKRFRCRGDGQVDMVTRESAVGGGPPSWADPELATLTRDRFSDPAWIFERKLDGERCLGFAGSSGVRLMSRGRKEITATFPEVARALAGEHDGDLAVDGEIVAFEGAQTRFERLQQRLGVARPAGALLPAVPVYYYVFDVLYAEDRDVRPLPLPERKAISKPRWATRSAPARQRP
jgi:ATP-dependent DNA ligase